MLIFSSKAVSYTHLHHAAGLPDIRRSEGFCPFGTWSFAELTELVKDQPLSFAPGTQVEQSATNFLVLTEIVERVSGMTYHDFVTKRQIEFLGLRHTGFAEDLDAKFRHEDVSLTGNVCLLYTSNSPTSGKDIPFHCLLNFLKPNS